MKKLEEIKVAKIYPHPKNPRKDLGDLTELTESIKTNGVLQNLTVVKTNEMDTYTVIIGHRRLAAAKAAGLETVPCYVADLDKKEQLEMMLTENVQRSDLTLLEEADGLQMVLDLGVSVKELAKDTGFSETTIRRKTSILKNDREKLEAADLRGGTLNDYLKLEAIKDPEEKARVLDAIGTDNFNAELQKAEYRQRSMEEMTAIENKISKFATKISSEEKAGMGLVRTETYGSYYNNEIREPAGSVSYYYEKYIGSSYWYIYVYKQAPESAESENAEDEREQEKEAYREVLHETLCEMNSRHDSLRSEFLRTCPARKLESHIRDIIRFGLRASMTGNQNRIKFCEIAGIKVGGESWNPQIDRKELDQALEESPERLMAINAYVCMLRNHESYWISDWHEGFALEPRDNEYLDSIYDFLISLGYGMSDEELDIQSGALIDRMRDEYYDRFPEEE